MTDRITKERRSALMSRIRAKDTRPEMVVRRLLHRMGLRFRLHRRDLPGCPDIVLARHGAVVFVHGCFWHRHAGCVRTTNPKSNAPFWRTKFRENRIRDRRVQRQLSREGWRVVVVWECETTDIETLQRRLRAELDLA